MGEGLCEGEVNTKERSVILSSRRGRLRMRVVSWSRPGVSREEAASLAHNGQGELVQPRAVAQEPPQKCPIELVEGEVLKARILDDARVQLVFQHGLVLVAHELARLCTLAAAHGVRPVGRQRRLGRFTDALAVYSCSGETGAGAAPGSRRPPADAQSARAHRSSR